MIIRFAAFDIVNFMTPMKRFLPPLLAIVVAAAIAPLPALSIVAAVSLMIIMAPNTFAADERGRLDTLYATLPITRRTIVVGRYVALIVLYLLMALVATAAAIVVTLAKGGALALDMLAMVNLGCLVVFAIVIAVQLPFFFSLGFTRARPVMYIPLIVIAGGAWLASQAGLLDGIDFGWMASLHPAAVAVPPVLVGAVVLAVSAAIAAARYARRPL